MGRFEPWEIALIRAANGPISIEARPFARIAAEAGISEEQALERLRAWKENGTIRRFGARVNHRKLGFDANGMSVWNVPADQVDALGRFMSEQPEVSHCYVRPQSASWPYNLYAMIHGKSEEAVQAVAQRIASHIGATDYRVLFSSKEFKKSAPRYFAEQRAGEGEA